MPLRANWRFRREWNPTIRFRLRTLCRYFMDGGHSHGLVVEVAVAARRRYFPIRVETYLVRVSRQRPNRRFKFLFDPRPQDKSTSYTANCDTQRFASGAILC